MNAQPPRILMIGDYRHREFAEPVAWLSRHAELTCRDSLSDSLPGDQHFQGVVLAQSRPGQITLRDVERIGQRWPLARLVALLGSWCEGETRSGDPWPGVTRVYWHQWRARCQRELRFDGPPTGWHLPRTATEVESATYALQTPPPRLNIQLGIFTQRALLYHGLAGICRASGCHVTWIRRVQEAEAVGDAIVLWDAGAGGEQEYAQLREFLTVAPSARVVVLMGFPRFDDLQLARQYGAVDMLALPLQAPDLWAVLKEVSARTPNALHDA